EAQAVLRVSAPNRFKLDWVRKNFSHQIEQLASEWYERPVQVTFELAHAGAAPRAPAATGVRVPAPPAADGNASAVAPVAPQAAPAATAAVAAAAEIVHDRSRLNTE